MDDTILVKLTYCHEITLFAGRVSFELSKNWR